MHHFYELVEKAKQIAILSHEGQTRADGSPYSTHPIAVAEILKEQFSMDYEILSDNESIMLCAAYLHDVLEDTELTAGDLREAGFPDRVIEVVQILTHERDADYVEYLLGVKSDPIATAVKLADIKHNIDTEVGHRARRDKHVLAKYLLESKE